MAVFACPELLKAENRGANKWKWEPDGRSFFQKSALFGRISLFYNANMMLQTDD
jgi:hypothetical protein